MMSDVIFLRKLTDWYNKDYLVGKIKYLDYASYFFEFS